MRIHIKDTDLNHGFYYVDSYVHQLLILRTILNDGWIDDIQENNFTYNNGYWKDVTVNFNGRKIHFYRKRKENESTP